MPQDNVNIPITGGLSGGADSILALLPPYFVQTLSPEARRILSKVPARFTGSRQSPNLLGHYNPDVGDIDLARRFMDSGLVSISNPMSMHESLHALDFGTGTQDSRGQNILSNSAPDFRNVMSTMYGGPEFNAREAVPMSLQVGGFVPHNLPDNIKRLFSDLFLAGALK